jgi:hypothetical protein
MIIEILFRLIVLHGPGGQVIQVNPDAIVSMRVPRGDEGHLQAGAKCIVNTADGKFSAVIETCQAVREMSEKPEER